MKYEQTPYKMSQIDRLQLLTENKTKFSTLEELDKLSREYVYEESEDMPPSGIHLNQDGTFDVNGSTLNGTRYALKGLCKILRIPNPFASRIPVDLLQKNIDRLGEEADFEAKFITRKDGTIVNFVKADFVGVPHPLLFEPLVEKYRGAEQLGGFISDNWLAVSFTKGEGETFKSFTGNSPNDHYDMGVVVINSPTGHITTQARVLLHRLVCMNQVIGPSNFDVVKCRPKPNRDLEAVVNNFIKGIDGLYYDLGQLQDMVKSMDRAITAKELKSVFNAVKKITGDMEFVDGEILQMDSTDRKEILTELRKFKQGQIEEPPTPDINLYDVFNNITEQAKTFDQEARYKLETYAGKLIGSQG